ncbi:MAG TPA: hypothetical protein VMT03_17405 [Polyangia bacterium]|nr:hypothetical protein [Polyangia bacterium]
MPVWAAGTTGATPSQSQVAAVASVAHVRFVTLPAASVCPNWSQVLGARQELG